MTGDSFTYFYVLFSVLSYHNALVADEVPRNAQQSAYFSITIISPKIGINLRREIIASPFWLSNISTLTVEYLHSV